MSLVLDIYRILCTDSPSYGMTTLESTSKWTNQSPYMTYIYRLGVIASPMVDDSFVSVFMLVSWQDSGSDGGSGLSLDLP